MTVPMFILAGQSNAWRLSDEVEVALEDQFGVGNFALVRVFESGAPLTRQRIDQPDWEDPDELREQLTVETINALLEDDDRVFGGMLWIQGEADTYAVTGANRYADRMEALLDEFRDDVAAAFGDEDVGLGEAPVTILELSGNAPSAPDRAAWDIVVDAQRDVAEADALVQTIAPDAIAQDANVDAADMFNDGLHYSDEFSVLLADELVQTLVSAEGAGGGEVIDVVGQEAPLPDVPQPDVPEPTTPEPTAPQPSSPEPIIPVIDPLPPEPDDEDDQEPAFEDASGIESIMWIVGLLPLLGALG